MCVFGFMHYIEISDRSTYGDIHESLQWQAIMDHLDTIKDQPGAKKFRSYLAQSERMILR